jgi:integrase
MAFALADSLIDEDPTLGVKPVRVGKSAGFYSWTEDDIAAFERRHPVGTTARLAFALMLYLGLRRSDVVRIGPQHVRNGMVCFTPQKNRALDRIHPQLPAASGSGCDHQRDAERTPDVPDHRSGQTVHGAGIRQLDAAAV